jgi:hypothetical protein
MYTQVTRDDFHRAFRAIRPDNFSFEGLDTLFDFLEELEEDPGAGRIELDVIAICCDFCEYENISAACRDYGINGGFDPIGLRDNTLVLDVGETGRVIVQAF